MKSDSRYTLQRTMIIYFLLIGFASLLVGLEFIAETNRQELKESILTSFEKYSNHEIEKEELFKPIDRLRNKAVLMIVIIMFVILIVLTMFIKNITEPLQHMIEVSKKISRGDLSRTVKIHSDNELSELGNVINEMSSNLQEIILLSRNMCNSGHEFVDRTSGLLECESINKQNLIIIKQEVINLSREIDMVDEFIDYFKFYSLKDQDGHELETDQKQGQN
ncbi:HAMP domain-containing protein [Desulfonema limicola]|uniref:histidine kinase n=1 Tax=Desulfonema limicola TaxID=45656 RepID=A0A975B3X5_9BACT|nr:HAMP domain-containing protein [Desulfonema limicola]QTA78306.1 HAMP domain-containing protein [Desulfonema limicola]